MAGKKYHALTVSYERLKTFGTYENVKAGLTVEVPDGKTADETFADVKAWVEEKIAKEVSSPRLEWKSEELKRIEIQLQEAKAELTKIREQLVKGKAILDAFVGPQEKTAEELKKEQFYDPFSPENEPDLGEEEE